ncbi:MAG TPA: hypothetical protein VJ553_05505 [Candidatus Paceibacterota bacterium]|nr:hypothetical protein [Candidatus Paceibacterota bacterium]
MLTETITQYTNITKMLYGMKTGEDETTYWYSTGRYANFIGYSGTPIKIMLCHTESPTSKRCVVCYRTGLRGRPCVGRGYGDRGVATEPAVMSPKDYPVCFQYRESTFRDGVSYGSLREFVDKMNDEYARRYRRGVYAVDEEVEYAELQAHLRQRRVRVPVRRGRLPYGQDFPIPGQYYQ